MPKSVRAMVDSLTIRSRTYAAGEVCEDCPDDRAKDLVARGLAEFVSADDARDLERTIAAQVRGAGPVETAVRKGPAPPAGAGGEDPNRKK